MKAAKVSIIIPVYNDQLGLNRCIGDILKQDFNIENVEVVVVDNGSIPAIKVDHHANDIDIRRVLCRKLGSYAARNFGVKQASGDFFAFIDADCWPDKNWLKRGIEAINQHGENAIAGGEVEIVKPAFCTAVALYQWLVGFGQESNIKDKKFSATANVICTRYQFYEIGDFNEDLLSGGDREWCWRAIHKQFNLIYVADSVVYTEPRKTLKGAIVQARRVASGRWMLGNRNATYVADGVLTKKRSILESVFWVLSNKKITRFERVKVLAVATVIWLAEQVERARLALGFEAERR